MEITDIAILIFYLYHNILVYLVHVNILNCHHRERGGVS